MYQQDRTATQRRRATRCASLPLAAALALLSAGPASACDLAVLGARLYASPTARPLPSSTVIIEDGRIRSVRRSIRAPGGCPAIDARGAVLVAGFWNSHVHFTTPQLVRPAQVSDAALTRELTDHFLRFGFTSVFDVASSTASALAVRARIASGAVKGPAVRTVGDPFYPAGGTPVYVRGAYAEHGLPLPEVDSPADAAARVEAQATAGVDGIKLFTGAIIGGPRGVLAMSLPVAQAASRAAHARRLPVFAHPSNAEGLAVAVDAGADVLAHVAPAMGPWPQAVARRLATRKVALVPTLALFETQPDPRTPMAVAQQQVRALHAAGGDILFGTDAGFTDEYDTTREFRLLGEVLHWRSVLASLTTAPAGRFGERRETGRVERGAPADLVLLEGDPARDVTAFARVRLTIRKGEVVYDAPPKPPRQPSAASTGRVDGQTVDRGDASNLE